MGLVVPLNVVAELGGLVQALRESRLRTTGRSVEAFLVRILVLGVGVGGLLAFMAHTAMADSTARSIGWPIGNPFQYQVAVTNLAIGALGILCYWIRGGFWTATVAAASVWLLGQAAIHVQQIVAVGNYSPDNAGIPLYLDVLTPLVLIALPIVYKVGGEGAATPRRALARVS